MAETVRWGILGPGIIANTFAHCLREVPGAVITGVGSRDMARSQEFCAKYGGTPYGTYEALAAARDVDIVYVATPHHLHERHAILCMRAGKAVLCEKPLAANAAQAENMYREAEKAGVLLIDGLWSRFFPAWDYARELLQSGTMGRLFAISTATSWGAVKNPQDRLFRPELAGGSLLDAGIYSLAAASLVLGPEYPEEIRSISSMGDTGVDEHDVVSMRYPSGVLFTMLCGVEGYLHETHFMCEKGTVTVPRHRNPDRVIVREPQVAETWRTGEISERRFPYVDEGFQFEARHAQDCLLAGLTASPRVPREESLTLLRIADEVRGQAGFRYPFE